EDKGSFNISAEQIKEFREPRLMAKFDHTINLPKLFSDNQLAILPITRGEYVISHFNAYHQFEVNDSPIINASLPTHIQSLNDDNIFSETIALNCAFASGIIAEFMEDSDIIATVSGRMGSGSFSFNIDDVLTDKVHQVNVNNSQIEIDAAYEGVASLALFEAKRDLSEDFLIRQLYYPFRVWKSRLTKQVRSIFLVYSNGIYRLYEYMFDDPDNYNSLRLVKQKNYSLEDTSISVSDIQAVLDSVSIIMEPQISFPQADKFERIINLCELVKEQELSRNEVTEQYDFDARQTNYYTDAARYLGLIDKRKENGTPLYTISETGRRILNLNFKQRQLAYCRLILSHKAFNETLKLYLQRGVMPSKSEIVNIMEEADLYQVESQSTFERRSSSISGWIKWIISLIND
ncbi:MAG: transcriptional regulator, partial [Alphaproteobacteria bacterium]|nr:transcriptional regulator [Alphaproteobacteria bacterium]